MEKQVRSNKEIRGHKRTQAVGEALGKQRRMTRGKNCSKKLRKKYCGGKKVQEKFTKVEVRSRRDHQERRLQAYEGRRRARKETNWSAGLEQTRKPFEDLQTEERKA